jgi:hypothetical protein
MVIWFNNDKARGFLLKQGFVYTSSKEAEGLGMSQLPTPNELMKGETP